MFSHQSIRQKHEIMVNVVGYNKFVDGTILSLARSKIVFFQKILSEMKILILQFRSMTMEASIDLLLR